MRFWTGVACGVMAVPALVTALMLSEPVEDLAMRALNSDWMERRWGP